MANANFKVKNGLTVGNLSLTASTGNISSSVGNITLFPVAGSHVVITGNLFLNGADISAAINTVSNAVSVVSNAVSVVSAQLVSVDTKLSTAINVVSQQISVISQQLSVMSNRISVVSSQMTSADNAISNAVSIVSAAQLSTWNAVSNEISVRAAASAALETHINNVSNAVSVVSNAVSVVSNAVSIVSAAQLSTWNAVSNEISVRAAASAALETHINTVSNAVSVVSNALSAVSVVVATNSAQMTSADNAISNAVSIVSAAQLSTWNAVSNEISVRAAASAALETHINTVSNAVSVVSAQVATNSAQMTSADNAISNAVSIVSAAQLSTWNRVSALLTSSTSFTGALYQFGNVSPSANITYSLGTTTARWLNVWGNTFNGTATTAQYADLAEIYLSDFSYAPGTVVVLAGDAEITQSTKAYDPRVAGVISDKPAYLMNSEAQGQAVALLGRVPCYVTGPITKGDRLVSSHKPGHAQKYNPDQYEPGSIIGKALQSFDGESGVIEILVGRT
jgi:hypothetical protein